MAESIFYGRQFQRIVNHGRQLQFASFVSANKCGAIWPMDKQFSDALRENLVVFYTSLDNRNYIVLHLGFPVIGSAEGMLPAWLQQTDWESLSGEVVEPELPWSAGGYMGYYLVADPELSFPRIIVPYRNGPDSMPAFQLQTGVYVYDQQQMDALVSTIGQTDVSMSSISLFEAINDQ